jgi:hypothetical protein
MWNAMSTARNCLLLVTVLLGAVIHTCTAQADDQLHIYRPRDLTGCLLHAHMTVDDTMHLSARNGGVRDLQLASGKHRLRTRRSTLDLDVAAGATTYVRVFFEFNFLFGRAVVLEVTENTANSEAVRTRPKKE